MQSEDVPFVQVQRKLAALALARATVKRERAALTQLDAQRAALEEATAVAQQVAQEVQRSAHEQIAGIVTSALEAVFVEDPYTFRILFERQRSRTEARLVFERRGLQVDPLSAAGGGVVDVAAFALRVACLVLARKRQRQLLVLDEPFRFVSPHLRGRVRALLEGLARDLGVQILQVTHSAQLCAGRVIVVGPKG
jgi:DNA repair exonuclease SbcCD ATPase subunit